MIKDIGDTFASFVNKIIEAYKTPTSLPEFTRATNVTGNVYIEATIADEEVLQQLMGVLNQFYIGFVLSALSLDQTISEGKTVRTMLGRVSSNEGYSDAGKLLSKSMRRGGVTVSMADDNRDKNDKGGGGSGNKVVELEPANQRLAAGRLLEFTFNLPGARNLKVNFMVTLIPFVIQSSIVEGFVNLNFSPGPWIRMRQYQAGELGLKDLLLGADQIAKHEQLLKQDRSGVLQDLSAKKSLKIFQFFRNLIKGTLHYNAASAVLVADRRTFISACSEAGLDWKLPDDRQRFFAESYCMMVALVDTMYTSVEVAFHGYSTEGTYSFNTINKVGKGKDSMDVKDMMTLMSQGLAPKF